MICAGLQLAQTAHNKSFARKPDFIRQDSALGDGHLAFGIVAVGLIRFRMLVPPHVIPFGYQWISYFHYTEAIMYLTTSFQETPKP